MTTVDQDACIFPFDRTSLSKRSVRGFVVTLVAQAAKMMLVMISAVVLSRILSATDFGLLAAVTPVTSLLALLSNVGLFQAIVQRESINNRQLTSLFWISVTIGGFLSLLFAASAPVLAWIYHNPHLIGIVLALSATVLLSSFVSVHVAILNRKMEFGKIGFIDVFCLTSIVTTSIIFSVAGAGYWALVYGQIVGTVVNVALAWILCPWRPSTVTAISSDVRKMMVFGRNLTVTNVAFYLNSSADNMLVGYRLGESALGLYDRAWKLAVTPLTQLIAPIDRVAIPSLSRLLDEPSEYRRYFKRLLELVLLVTAPGLIAVTFCAPFVVPGLLGEKWHALTPIFQWLCIGGLLAPVNGATFWLFVSQARSKEQLSFTIAAIAINISAYLIGITWGLEGVTRTSALSVYLFQAPLLVYGSSRNGPVNLKNFLDAMIAPAAAILLVSIGSCLCRSIMVPDSLIRVIFFFLQAYLVGALAVALTPNGRLLLGEAYSFASAVLIKRFGPLLAS